ncbi:L-histidine N(alpha)-methyltransferase [Pontibacter vulgaris]|uniref:L-histidine N(alpha)-methyltransferase n=1 Tax=Pontibacter vulgaris TaxID=2905679 RepID=UPI001FA7D5AE|nr:L-histidine N(alpha)-methyltransferase [Pontibacter vulgaris]
MQLNHTLHPLTIVSQQSDAATTYADFAKDITNGLNQTPKKLSSRWFYDAKGSKLFQQIMDMPEYYLTRCEFDLLNEHKQAMASQFGKEGFFHLIDLGAGDAMKTKVLIRELTATGQNFEYVPVDISVDAMQELTEDLHEEMPAVLAQAVVGEYFDALKWLQENKSARKVVLFLGSNVGNFETQESINFLKSIRSYLQPGDKLLLGADLRKDPETIIDAYNDAAGITAEFNLNLLERMNRELGANFNLQAFQHYALYDPQEGVMKSYLVSRTDQQVDIHATGQSYTFKAWEAIHTESSHKYTLQQIQELGKVCGFNTETVFMEKNQYFADVLFTVD